MGIPDVKRAGIEPEIVPGKPERKWATMPVLQPSDLRPEGASCHLRPRCGDGRWPERVIVARPLGTGQLFNSPAWSPGGDDPLGLLTSFSKNQTCLYIGSARPDFRLFPGIGRCRLHSPKSPRRPATTAVCGHGAVGHVEQRSAFGEAILLCPEPCTCWASSELHRPPAASAAVS